MPSLLRDRLVQVQDHAGHRGVGGQFGCDRAARSRAPRRRRAASAPQPRSCSVVGQVALEASPAGSSSRAGRGVRASAPAGRPESTAPASVPPCCMTSLGQHPRRLDEGHVVHQVQRLQRRVGARLADRRRFRGRRHRRSSSPAAPRSASRRCTGCGGRGPRRGRACNSVSGQFLPQSRRAGTA